MALADEIDKKFPEFNELRIRYGEEQAVLPPHIFCLIAAAALNTEGPSCAFIIPQPEMVACFTSLLAALSDTKKHFVERREEFAMSGIQAGQNVQILPTGEVYEYDGIREYAFRAHPHGKKSGPAPEARFSLRLLGVNSNNGTISLPLSDVLRLLPTDRVQPYGRGQTPKEKMALSDLDKILKIQSYGNPSVFRNRIIIQGTKQQIESFLSCWDICNPEQSAVLKDLTDIPWGTINSSGELISSDRYQVCGEPLIAFANRLSPIDAYCSGQEEKSQTVISFSRKAVLKDSYDAGGIVEKQKLILITDHLDEQECNELRNQSIEIWKLGKEEIFLGMDTDTDVGDKKYAAPIRKMLVAASTGSDAVSSEVAQSKVFQSLCDGITALKKGIEDRDTRNIVTEGFQRVLWRSSELFSLPGQAYQDWLLDQIMGIEKSLTDHSAYIKKDLADIARNMVSLISEELLPDIEKNSEEKFNTIKKIADSGRKILVLTRHDEAEAALKKRLQTVCPGVSFLTYGEIGSFIPEKGAGFEMAVMVGWPGKHLFLDLLQAGIADNIKAVLYPHEKRILDSFFRQRKSTDGKLNPPSERKEEITGLPAALFVADERMQEESPPGIQEESGHQGQLRVNDSDDVFDVSWSVRPSVNLLAGSNARPVKAKLVSLSNDMCLYISEDQHMSVISPVNHEYRRKTADELALGDIIVFRGGGEKEILREVATSIYGDSYDKLWAIAILWKTWLKSLGSGPTEIWQKLVAAGLNRHLVTISQWLSYDDRIGPQNLNDILVIAQATGNEDNVKKVPRVADAIKQIRGVHVEAGFKLTAIVMQNLAKGPAAAANENSELARKFSDVRLYKVEDIDDQYQDVASNLVNAPHPLWLFKQGGILDDLMKDIANG